MKKVFVRTYGCKTNQYESQVIKELAVKNGYELVEDYKIADIVIINTCSVTKPAERDVYKFLRRVYRDSGNKKFFLTGCFAEYLKITNGYSAFWERLGEDLDITFLGNKEKYRCVSLSEVKEKISSFYGRGRAYVKIQDGCDNFCSYCIVPYLRRELYSKPKNEVVKEVQELEKNRFNEIVLVGINIGKYQDIAEGKIYNLVDLAEEILTNTEVTLIFSSIEVTDLTEKFFNFIDRYKHRIFSHFHIPLQSGDDKILHLMNRKYTVSEYKDKINRLRKIFPRVIISADVIVGYPEETKEQFINTKNVIKELKLNWVHVFPYSARKHTIAYKKYGEFVPYDVKHRVREICKLNEELNEKYYKQLCRVE